jgi:hypothetical protein
MSRITRDSGGFNRFTGEVGALFLAVLRGCESCTFRGKRRVRATDVKNTADNTMDRRANALVISEVKPKHSLGSLAVISKHFGLIMRTSDYIEKVLMFGLTDGSSRSGRHRARWTDEMQGTLTMNWHDILTVIQNGTQGGT